MKERLTRQLGPEAKLALRLAQRLVGKEPVLKRVPSLPNDCRAMLRRPPFPRQPYEIHFAAGEEPSTTTSPMRLATWCVSIGSPNQSA